MPVPQDSRSPYRNQRWVECQAASQDIPAFALVQVTGSSRPEKAAAGLTPGGGRTVLQVAEVTTACVGLFMVTGQKRIPSGELGYCTNDYPTYVRWGGLVAPAVGEDWGPVSGNPWEIRKDGTGFLILDDAELDTTLDPIVRVLRQPASIQLALGALAQDVCPSDETANISDATELSTCRSLGSVAALNDFTLAGCSGDSALAVYSCCDNSWHLIQVATKQKKIFKGFTCDSAGQAIGTFENVVVYSCCPGETTQVIGTEVQVVTDIFQDGTGTDCIKITPRVIVALCADDFGAGIGVLDCGPCP